MRISDRKINTTSAGIKEARERTCSLDIDKVHIVGSRMHNRPEEHLVSHLSMEPDVFISRERPRKPRSDDSDYVPQHGDEDETTIKRKHKTRSTGDPDGEPERIQTSQSGIRSLRGVMSGRRETITRELT